MCDRKEMFSKLDETSNSEVKFRNGTTVPIKGKYKISIKFKDESQNFISNVLYVPSLHQNLISMKKLSMRLYNIRIYEGICTINDDHKGLIEM